MTDIPGPSEDFQAEIARIASKPEAISPKPAKQKKQPKPEFTTTSKDEDPALVAAHEFKAATISMTTKESRALVSLKRSPKPPVPYSQDIADQILSLMADGFMLVEICERDDMPSIQSVLRWCRKIPDFDVQLTRAREALGDQFAWEVKRVADDSTPWTAAADRVKMDGYRWLAAKMYPKQYGDKTTQEVVGTITHETKHVIDATQLSPENIDKLEAVLRAAQGLPAPEDSSE